MGRRYSYYYGYYVLRPTVVAKREASNDCGICERTGHLCELERLKIKDGTLC